MTTTETTTARRPRRIRPEAPTGDDAFACEIAIALDAIENLTPGEAASVVSVCLGAQCEPLLPFLALHVRLAYVVGSPHGRQFCAALREWRANELLDAALWRACGRQHRPRYRAGIVTPADVAKAAGRFKEGDLTLIGATARPPAPQTREERREIVAGLAIGDVVRWRHTARPDRWYQARVVEVTPHGTVYACEDGRNKRISISCETKYEGTEVEIVDPAEVQ